MFLFSIYLSTFPFRKLEYIFKKIVSGASPRFSLATIPLVFRFVNIGLKHTGY